MDGPSPGHYVQVAERAFASATYRIDMTGIRFEEIYHTEFVLLFYLTVIFVQYDMYMEIIQSLNQYTGLILKICYKLSNVL